MRIRSRWTAGAAGVAALAVVAAAASTGMASAAPAAAASTHYDHVFLVVEENNGFSDIIGNKAAPNFNSLAQTYGLATNYYGVSHPSEPNYVAMLGGSTFGINSDNPYFTDTVDEPSLMSQLDGAGVSWKAYLQGVPQAGYQGMCYPTKCNGAPDSDPLYAAKHNGIVNFAPDQTPADWAKQAPYTDLAADLKSGNVPQFGYIIPDECHDMHGDPPFCLDSGNIFDPQNQHLVTIGDQFLGQTVQQVTSAPFWSQGNNAIVVTYDEGDNNVHGGGQVATVVVTSHGPRSFEDASFYNHYSLLATLESNFGVPCLQGACAKGIKPLSPFLTVTGSSATPYKPLSEPTYSTPSPLLPEKVGSTGITATAAGWTSVSTPTYGTLDNNLGAIASDGPNDVWAVGSFLPSAKGSNSDATLALAEHYNGTTWTIEPPLTTGSNFSEFYGVAASGGKAWAVGTYQDANYNNRALLEYWNGTTWNLVKVPQPGSQRDLLYGISAVSPTDLWAVGEQEGADGVFRSLTEHFDGTNWTVVPSANPGSNGDVLHGVDAVSANDVYAVGQQIGTTSASDQALVEHWDGQTWSPVTTPASTGEAELYGVTVSADGDVYATGASSDPTTGYSPTVLEENAGTWQYAALPSTGSNWTYMNGIASSGDTAYAVGTAYDATSGNQVPVLLSGSASAGWAQVAGPNPSGTAGNNIPGGIANTGSQLWIAGTFDNGGNNLPLLEHN